MLKKQTYLESYVDFGFDFIVTDDAQKPQCVFCSKVLGNGVGISSSVGVSSRSIPPKDRRALPKPSVGESWPC